MNLGAVLRTGHAFGASFVFTIDAHHRALEVERADTSATARHVPLYKWASIEEMRLPAGCALIGVELADDAIEMPAFRHPSAAAYLLGPEMGSLSPAAAERCDYIVKIPTRFCVNLSVAAAIVMYDRTLALGGYPVRGLTPVEKPPPQDTWRMLSRNRKRQPAPPEDPQP